MMNKTDKRRQFKRSYLSLIIVYFNTFKYRNKNNNKNISIKTTVRKNVKHFFTI